MISCLMNIIATLLLVVLLFQFVDKVLIPKTMIVLGVLFGRNK